MTWRILDYCTGNSRNWICCLWYPTAVRSVPICLRQETLNSGLFPARLRVISLNNTVKGTLQNSPFSCTMTFPSEYCFHLPVSLPPGFDGKYIGTDGNSMKRTPLRVGSGRIWWPDSLPWVISGNKIHILRKVGKEIEGWKNAVNVKHNMKWLLFQSKNSKKRVGMRNSGDDR